VNDEIYQKSEINGRCALASSHAQASTGAQFVALVEAAQIIGANRRNQVHQGFNRFSA